MPVYTGDEAHEYDLDPWLIGVCVADVSIVLLAICFVRVRNRLNLAQWPDRDPEYSALDGTDTQVVSNPLAEPEPVGAEPEGAGGKDDVRAPEIGAAAPETDAGGQPGSGRLQEAGALPELSFGTGLRVIALAAKLKLAKEQKLLDDKEHRSREDGLAATVFKGIEIKDDAGSHPTPYGLLQMLVGLPQAVGLPAMVLSHLGQRLGLNHEEWAAWFDGGSLVTMLAVASVLGPFYLCAQGPLWSGAVLCGWFGSIGVVLVLFIAVRQRSFFFTAFHCLFTAFIYLSLRFNCANKEPLLAADAQRRRVDPHGRLPSAPPGPDQQQQPDRAGRPAGADGPAGGPGDPGAARPPGQQPAGSGGRRRGGR